MPVVVITPPEPIVTPADIPGDHSADDKFISLLISGVQAEIDGAAGWLGRSLGVQTLELTDNCLPERLPFRPIIGIDSVSVDGVEVDKPDCHQNGCLTWGRSFGGGKVVIRYRAGYDNDKTGPIPPNAQASIILGVNLIKAIGGEEDIFLQQESVTGAHSMTRNVTPYVAETIQKAVSSLLSPLQVYL